MQQDIQVIKITEKNIDGYDEVTFFAGLGINSDGHLVIKRAQNPLDAMIFSPLPESTIGVRQVQNLVEFIQKSSFKGTNVTLVNQSLKF